MDTQDLIKKIQDLRNLQSLIAEAEEDAEVIKDALKLHMGEQEELRAGEYKITWKEVKSARLDSTALKTALPDVYKTFSKETVTRPFKVS